MSRKVITTLLIVGFCVSIYFTGCAQQAQLSLRFTPEDTTVYKITTETRQSYKFDQPSIDKVKEEQTGTVISMTLRQEVQSVDQKGGAVSKITIEAIKAFIEDKSGVKFDYDSTRETDKGKPFSKLIGKSYRIHIAPDGKATTVDAKALRATLTSGYDARILESRFSDKAIADRHEILALPDTEASELKVGDSWSRLKGSHPKLLIPKSFEKIYTLKGVKTQGGRNVAIIEMDAIESAVAAPDAPKGGGMGFFGNVFDPTETLTGQMILDLDAGKVTSYKEILVGTYVALDPSQTTEKADKDPDSLTMGFIHSISMELIK